MQEARMREAYAALGDPVRRRVLEILVGGEHSAGEIGELLAAFGAISQPAVSQHLRALRDAGLVVVRVAGTRRIYALDRAGIETARSWLDGLLAPVAEFAQPLDALATEVARGRRRADGEAGRRASAG